MWQKDLPPPNPFSIGAGLREQDRATCSGTDEQHCTNCGCSSAATPIEHSSILRQDEDSHAYKLALDKRQSIINEQETALFLSKEAHENFEATLVKRLVELEEHEFALGERETALKKRETALGERETALRERETALGDRETALFLKNEQLDEREQAFRKREQAHEEHLSELYLRGLKK